MPVAQRIEQNSGNEEPGKREKQIDADPSSLPHRADEAHHHAARRAVCPEQMKQQHQRYGRAANAIESRIMFQHILAGALHFCSSLGEQCLLYVCTIGSLYQATAPSRPADAGQPLRECLRRASAETSSGRTHPCAKGASPLPQTAQSPLPADARTCCAGPR